jgi:hypothetical protein
MPKELTHILFADALLDELDQTGRNDLASPLERHRSTLHFGSIATDTLYYELTFPIIDRDYAHWGEIIHGGRGEDTGTPIREMLRRLQNHPQNRPPSAQDDARFAFVCGFLSHMALDIVFHPWVYAVTGLYYDPDPDRQADSQMSHRLVESWLDLLMLQRFEKTRNNFDPFKAIRANKITNIDCLDFFAESFRTAWRIEGDVGRYIRRFHTVQMLLGRLFSSRTATTAVALLNRLSKGRLRAFTALFYPTHPERMPTELFEFQSFRHPVTGRTIASNLDQLWAEARQLGARLLITAANIRAGEAPEALDAVLEGRSLNIGLPRTPSDLASHFDIFPVERMWGYPGPAAGIAR